MSSSSVQSSSTPSPVVILVMPASVESSLAAAHTYEYWHRPARLCVVYAIGMVCPSHAMHPTYISVSTCRWMVSGRKMGRPTRRIVHKRMLARLLICCECMAAATVWRRGRNRIRENGRRAYDGPFAISLVACFHIIRTQACRAGGIPWRDEDIYVAGLAQAPRSILYVLYSWYGRWNCIRLG